MATISLGGTTIPNVTKCDRTDILIGKQERAHDGTLLTDYTAQIAKWAIEAVLLTESERDTVKALVQSVASQAFVDLDSASFTVVATQGTYNETRQPAGGGGILYAITFEVEEAS